MQVEIGRHVALNLVEELAELPRTVARHAFADHRSGLHVRIGVGRRDQRGKQRGSPVTLVVVRAPLDLAGAHRQQRLRAVERLDLALLVYAQHERALRRIEVEPDDIAYLLDELWVGRELERLDAMRLQRERLPDAMHRRSRHARRSCHPARAPMRRVRRLSLERPRHDLLDPVITDLAWRTASRLVVEPVETSFGKPSAPRLHRRARYSDGSRDRAVAVAIGSQQYDLGTHRVRRRNRRSTSLRSASLSTISTAHTMSLSESRCKEHRIRLHLKWPEISATGHSDVPSQALRSRVVGAGPCDAARGWLDGSCRGGGEARRRR